MTRRNLLSATVLGLPLLVLYAFTLPKPPAGWKSYARARLQNLREFSLSFSTDTLPPLKDRQDDFMNPSGRNPIDLQDPKAIEKKVEYDPVTDRYIIIEKIGEDYFRTPSYMTFEEYVRWRERQQREEHFNRMLGVSTPSSRKSSTEDPAAKFDVKTSLVERLFGGTNVDIRPQGNINLRFGYQYQKVQNPILTLRQQRIGNFDFDMDINMSAAGQVGEKLKINFNFNNRAVFDFDNQMKIHYDPKGFSEDEIIQSVEAGNVSLPLRSNLIQGVQNLFGFKTGMKFGHLNVTLLAAQQRSRRNNLTLQGGSQVQQFVKPVDEYDENRHFLISHWNRDQFEPALACLPVPQSLFNITRMEVWLTNVTRVPDNTRDIVAFMDLGEPFPYLDGSEADRPDFSLPAPPARDIKGQPLPTNENNRLYSEVLQLVAQDSTVRFSDKIVARLRNDLGLQQVRDFEKVRGRLLSPNEYTYNEHLGFLSINTNVQPDQVVAIAVEYTYNGQPYKIGEFSSEVPNTDTFSQNVLFLKMLKSTTANVRYPIWDLMMKNVYSIGAVNVDPQEFRFDIFYEDPGKGQRRFLNADDIPPGVAGVPLLQLFKMDSLNLQGDPGPDGIFDFVPGLTINLRNGRVMFPVLEPFGEHLARKLRAAGAPESVVQKYAYPQLYDSTLFRAREFQQLNRFILRGSYKSSTSSEISLGTFNLPRGSVRVSAGGRQLIEGQDYVVDYNIGKVRILNESILQSGQPVNVSFEDNALFSFQNRSMFGARFDYTIGKDINIGATYMNLFERPLIQKVNFGDDPINNRMYGLDFNISKEVPWITRLIDKIPLIDTKAPSTITAQAEVALLHPGHNRAINVGDDRGGVVYIDDFEGSTANLPLANPANSWVIASVPQGDPALFPEADLSDNLALGANRARLSWYIADPSARDAADAKNPYTRIIQFQDIFPNRQLTPLEVSALRPLDVTIFPRERGPYNFELPDGYPGISQGLTVQGELDRPETRWAGFMRSLFTVDFEAANIEFIEFWMLNPYMDKGDGSNISKDGDMYIDLGNISEDIMRDGRQFFENALPTGTGIGSTTSSAWGRVPVLPPVVNAFDNDPTKRPLQDLGLDGLDDDGEREFFADWLNIIQNSALSPNAKAAIWEDPSNDNFRFFRDPIYEDTKPGLLERYKRFNNQQGNSPVNETVNLNPSATNFPDAEDLNRDNSLNETEAYFRYKVPLKKRTITFSDGLQMEVIDTEHPELRDLITDTVVFDRDGARFVWYRFKLPLDHPRRQTINGIQDFRSIRFVRMFWKGFTERTTFRFATLELGRNQWRRYTLPLPNKDPNQPGGICDVGPPTNFDVNAVSIEQNAARTPFNYTIPPGISRQQSVGAFPNILQNEQALSMNMCDLSFCDARAVFKILNMDLRQFDRLKMFAHAEGRNGDKLDSTHLSIFIRLGSDFISNYYEYELPLMPSDETRLNGNPESREYKLEVWRPENNFDIPLRLFTEIKKQRNADPNWDVGLPFVGNDLDEPRARVKVVGNPNLGYVRGVMVGVRNVDPNLQPHCAEVWINELRLNGFNEQVAYAGQARVDIKLADLGNISLSGRYTGIGWGSMEQKLVQRQREEVVQYDVSASIELGRFFPKNSGLRLPFYVQYSNITRTPEFDPYDLDIKLREKLSEADPSKRDSIRRASQEVTIIRGYNFTNVRKDRVGAPRKVRLPWNIENFSLTYAFNQERRRTPFIDFDELNRYKGAVDWQYATGLKAIEPFKNLVKNDKYLRWLKEFNFNPLPNTYAFNTTLERVRQITAYRFAGEDPALNTFYNRRFTWDRNYDIGWEITRNLRFNFNAQMRSLIDEPPPFINGEFVTPEERRDSILKNMLRLGRPKNYTHNLGLNYTLPFKYLPLLDWITVRASYNGGYTWTAQSLKLQFMGDVPPAFANEVNLRSLGHVIQNQSVRQINGDLNFEGLYNKSKYLAQINSPRGRGPSGPVPPGGRGNPLNRNLPGGDSDLPSLPGVPGGSMPRRDKPPSGRDLNDPAAPGGATPTDPSAPSAGTDKKGQKGKSTPKEKREKNQNRQPSTAERIALRPLMLVRKARFTYSENFGTVVPGFTPDAHLMGLSQGFNAPGWAFVAGVQPNTDWLFNAAANGWITQRPELNQQVTRNYTQNADLAITVEPFRDFRIEITANRQYARNNTELFKDQNFILHPDSTDYQSRAYRDFGSFTVSYLSLQTMFDPNINGLFARYETYRSTISDRLAQKSGNFEQHDKDGPAYRKGYGKIHQEVLIPAFIAAYTEKDPNTVPLDIFKTLPAPNWRLNYNGLHKVKPLDKVFASVQITHAYRNTLTVNSFNTDIFFDRNNPYQLDTISFNYIAQFEIPQVVINEQFSPLLGLDVRLKNDMTFKVDYKKSRMLAMSFVDYQLAETQSSGFTVGFGYRMRNVNIAFLTGKKKPKARKKNTPDTAPSAPAPPSPFGSGQQANDMTFKFDLDIRDDVTLNHRLDQLDEAVPTRGARIVSINPSVDYALNRRLTLRLFADYRRTVPKTSQSFPITTLNTGVMVRFSLN